MCLFFSFLEVSTMTEERRLMNTGIPLEDAISMCYDLRREGTLSEFIRSAEQNRRRRVCNAAFACPDRPKK